MASGSDHRSGSGDVWALVGRQYGVVTRSQLLSFGLTAPAIRHRVDRGRLHRVWPGVYAVGRPQLTQQGQWLAAVLTCGPEAMLSHGSATSLFGVATPDGRIEVSVPTSVTRRRPGIRVHRRSNLAPGERILFQGIPVTAPALALVDVAARAPAGQVEAAINKADKLDLIDPVALRKAIDRMPRRPGIAVIRRILDPLTFVLTDSELERRLLPIARRAGLPQPLTQTRLNGFRVDFYWPDLGLVVETDGLRYHRTPAQQATDRRREGAHAAAGLTSLRFTHAQVRYEPATVHRTLSIVASRLRHHAA